MLPLTSINQIPIGYFQLVTSLLSSVNLFKTPFLVSLKCRQIPDYYFFLQANSANRAVANSGSYAHLLQGHGLDRAGSGCGQVAGNCECGNEPSGSIKCGEFID